MLARIAFRNIFRNRRRSAITLFVVVFGAVALILFGGYKEVTFRGLRESTIRDRLGHIQIYARGYLDQENQKPLEHGLERMEDVRRAVEQDSRVEITTGEIGLIGLVSNGEKSETFLATAVEPDRDHRMRRQWILQGSSLSAGESDDVIIGQGLATSMSVKPGDHLTLMTTTVHGSLNAMDVRVAGIFSTGVKEYDDRAVKMALTGAQRLLQTNKVEKLIVILRDTSDTDGVKRHLERFFQSKQWPLDVRDWSQLATFYHQVVSLYNGIFGFLGIVVFAVVILSVANTVMMSTFERTREIGTLMSMGTSRIRVWTMFLFEGFFVGVLGGMLGLLTGVVLSQGINHLHLMLPPPPGYTVGYRLQILLRPSILVTALVIALVTTTLSSVVPAFKASRLKIVDALGHI
jgi:putative ABC transport system permease protein